MAYWIILGVCAVVAWIAGTSGISAQLTPHQILIIADGVTSICTTIKQAEGHKSDPQIKADVNAELGALIGRVANVGGFGVSALSREQYEGLSRDATATALQSDRDCREQVFNQIVDTISARNTLVAGTLYPVLPSRMFAGPTQYPPVQFKAYGIVAFPAISSSDDKSRYDMICNAYISALPHYTSLPLPFKEQMVTVWPIDTDKEATQINEIARDKVCARAVPNYGLVPAQQAIEAAKTNKAVLNGRGPFLLGWAPGSEMGQPDALVLVSNLSNVANLEDAKSVFQDWAKDIQENPDLWNNGWKMDKLTLFIRLWADRYGDEILQYFRHSS
jgi:hypothetical protein